MTFLEPSIVNEETLTFIFLNRIKAIKIHEDWNNKNLDKLWLYNLHYHSFLISNLISSAFKKRIIEQWILQNPWPIGVGWEPYPLSLRIVNWIKYSLIENQKNEEIFKKSLFLQCSSLEKQIEYHILGNHLFENAKALFFAGIYFDTKKAKKWLRKGVSILYEQLKEQVLKDGGHFERSPMYHAIILEGVLDIYQLILMVKKDTNYQQSLYNENSSLVKLEKTIQKIIPKMLLWFSSLSHHDENIAFFNDSTFDIAPKSRFIYEYASFLGFHLPIQKNKFLHFKESGFLRIENSEALILADVGSVGPSYIPGHAHAETLSFETSLKGERLFVNNGISTYNVSEERSYQRSTLAHNTIAINKENSSEVWSSFRVAKRAEVFDIHSNIQHSNITFSAAHNGYQRLKYNLIHKREWSLFESKIIINDFLTGRGAPSVRASLHLHPNWQIVLKENNTVIFQSLKTQQLAKVIFSKDFEIQIEDYDYAVGFNNKKKAYCFRLSTHNKLLPFSLQTEIGW